MAIKPIDIQVNISQMLEVGKNEHVRNAAIAEQQYVLDKESADKSTQVNTKLDETRKGERTAIRDDESKKKEKGNLKKKESKKKKTADKLKTEISYDEKMGRIVDILK